MGLYGSGKGGCSSYAASEADHAGHASPRSCWSQSLCKAALARAAMLPCGDAFRCSNRACILLAHGVRVGIVAFCSRRLYSGEVRASPNSWIARLLFNAVKQNCSICSQLVKVGHKAHGLITRSACLRASRSPDTRKAICRSPSRAMLFLQRLWLLTRIAAPHHAQWIEIGKFSGKIDIKPYALPTQHTKLIVQDLRCPERCWLRAPQSSCHTFDLPRWLISSGGVSRHLCNAIS